MKEQRLEPVLSRAARATAKEEAPHKPRKTPLHKNVNFVVPLILAIGIVVFFCAAWGSIKKVHGDNPPPTTEDSAQQTDMTLSEFNNAIGD